MIWRPKPGQVVIIKYARRVSSWNGQKGTVLKAGTGPGPINVLVCLNWHDHMVIVPRGHLFKEIKR